ERYTKVKKLLYALFMASRKLWHYFQAHNIVVPTGFPLGSILHSPDVGGCIAKWAMGLTEFDIKFTARTAIKSQVLDDFTIELATPSLLEPSTEDEKPWTMYFDGSRSYGLSGAGILIISPQGEKLRYVVHFDFSA